MKIAFFITPQKEVPPINYGGHERQADIMCRKMEALGHSVDLYCGEGSTCPVNKIITSYHDASIGEKELYQKWMVNADKYDCTIDFTDNRFPSVHEKSKTIAFFMGDDFRLRPHDNIKNRVYCSKEMAYNWNSIGYPIVPNTFYDEKEDIPFIDKPKNYALYVGLVDPKKGIHLAVNACQIANIPLLIAGPINNLEYWGSIKDLPGVEYVGLVGRAGRWGLFGRAKVFLHLPQVCDAGPLAPMEAMACGVPVVATPHGGICSSIKDGVSGFFAFTPKDIAERISRIDVLDRTKVREAIFEYSDSDENIRKILVLAECVSKGKIW